MKKKSEQIQILVTGGAGFIGTHLVNELVRRYKDPVIDVVDNLSNSAMPPRRLEFYKKHNITFYEQAVEDFTPERGRRYDYIYHLASPVGPAGVLRYAGRMGSMIVNDAIQMAELALAHDAKLLTVSTSEVYGQNPLNDQPQPEDLPKIVPAKVTIRLEYGVGKLLKEIVLMNLAKENPLKVNFIRPFNIVGPYQNGEAGFVLPRFVAAALKNEPITVFGDGLQRRTFTHVSDIVNAFIMLMESGIAGNVYNVGNPENICSIKDLAHKVVKLTGSKSEVRCVDPKSVYGKHYEEAWNKIPNIARISQDLGWKPKYTLDAILTEYVDFARGKLDVLHPQI